MADKKEPELEEPMVSNLAEYLIGEKIKQATNAGSQKANEPGASHQCVSNGTQLWPRSPTTEEGCAAGNEKFEKFGMIKSAEWYDYSPEYMKGDPGTAGVKWNRKKLPKKPMCMGKFFENMITEGIDCHNRRREAYIDMSGRLSTLLALPPGKFSNKTMEARRVQLSAKLETLRKQSYWGAKNLLFLVEFKNLGDNKDNDQVWLETLMLYDGPRPFDFQWPKLPVYFLENMPVNMVAHMHFARVCEPILKIRVDELMKDPEIPMSDDCHSIASKLAWLENVIRGGARASFTDFQLKDLVSTGLCLWTTGQLEGKEGGEDAKGKDKDGNAGKGNAGEDNPGESDAGEGNAGEDNAEEDNTGEDNGGEGPPQPADIKGKGRADD